MNPTNPYDTIQQLREQVAAQAAVIEKLREALWMKQNTPELTDLWAKILIRNKRATGASSAEDTCHPTTE